MGNGNNETVKVILERDIRLRLDCQINDRMRAKGLAAYDYNTLDLGFKLEPKWPADMNCEVTLAQLTVVAHALDMQIEITNLDLLKVKEV